MNTRVVLCGAKGAGKSELLKAYEKINLGKGKKGVVDYPYLIPNQLDSGKWGDWAMDRLADYRTELYVALDRADDEVLPHAIYESSLIDSVAYAATRLSYIINEGTGTDDDLARWEITLHATARMLRDSVLPDAFIYVPGHDDEDFYAKLEESIIAAIWEFIPKNNAAKFELKETDPLLRAEETAKILEGLNEQRNTDTESDGEDN